MVGPPSKSLPAVYFHASRFAAVSLLKPSFLLSSPISVSDSSSSSISLSFPLQKWSALHMHFSHGIILKPSKLPSLFVCSTPYVVFSTMKPFYRFLVGRRHATIPRFPSAPKRPYFTAADFSRNGSNSPRDGASEQHPLRAFHFYRRIYPNPSSVCSPISIRGGIRHHSTSVEPHVGGDKKFEKIYVQGSGVEPLVAERIERDENFHANVKESEVADESNVRHCCQKLEGVGQVEVSPRREREASKCEVEAWNLLSRAVVNYCGSPIGTVAANDPAENQILNYDQVFIRDFVPSALAFLLKGESEIVRNFLLHTLQLQSWEKTVDCYSPGQGLMPASFKVRTVPLDGSNEAFEEVLDPDFGESAIGRVAPVDSGLWWIILLRAYGKITGDYALQERVDVQTGIKLVLNLCLSDGFDMFPSLLVTDGSCMIDRRMGIHGHPLEIQALFYSALLCSLEMINVNDGSKNLVGAINNRLSALSFHIRAYYWVDMMKINEIYRYKTEEYSLDAINKFNIYPDQVPTWLVDWIPEKGGYLIGNLQPAHMDFRFFSLGNIWSVVSSLATPRQSEGIIDLIEAKWDDLIGMMPLKICYPAMEFEEWRLITGSDPKNTPWSYHNGGSWPTLLWQFTLACIKMNRPDLAQKAVDIAEKRLIEDKWPEYYDTRAGRFIGKQARLYQTWTIAGYLTSKLLLDNPEKATMLSFNENSQLLEECICATLKTPRKKCSRIAARSQFLV